MAATGSLQETVILDNQKGCPVTEPCPDGAGKGSSVGNTLTRLLYS